jgi:hypothetical protein
MITTPNNFRDNYVVVLDSLDRDLAKYPDPANYVIALPETLRNVETIELMSFQITRTETNVNSGNNKFKIVEYQETNSSPPQTVATYVHDITIEIADSDYDGATFLTKLITALTTNRVTTLISSSVVTPPSTYTAELDAKTNKITIYCDSTMPPYNVHFGIQVEESSAKLLGIAGTDTRGSGMIKSLTGSINGSTKEYITGRNAIDLRGIPYLILYLNDYERIIAPGSHSHKNFLVVPMEDKPVGTRFIISGDQKEKKGIYILTNNQKNIYEMRVTIRRPDGTLYDFKGTDHLLIFRVYRHDYRDFNS